MKNLFVSKNGKITNGGVVVIAIIFSIMWYMLGEALGPEYIYGTWL